MNLATAEKWSRMVCCHLIRDDFALAKNTLDVCEQQSQGDDDVYDDVEPLDRTLASLGVPTATCTRLANYGIETARDVLEYDRKAFLELRGISVVSFEQIRSALAEIDIDLPPLQPHELPERKK